MKSLYDEPRLYDLLFDSRRRDVGFYRSIAAHVAKHRGSTARLFEYGAGTGRITLALAADGHHVSAIENAPAMVASLRTRIESQAALRDRISVVESHVLDATLPAHTADAVICPFNGLAHFETSEAIAACLSRVHEHLAPDGLFAFDVWLPLPSILSGSHTVSPWFDDPSGSRIRFVERFTYEPMTQVLIAIIDVEDDRGIVRDHLRLRLRQFFPAETLTLLERHGFRTVHRSTTFEPISDDAPLHVAMQARGMPGEMVAYVCAGAHS